MHTIMKTAHLSKDELMRHAADRMDADLAGHSRSLHETVALTCHILFRHGHDSGLAGQITALLPDGSGLDVAGRADAHGQGLQGRARIGVGLQLAADGQLLQAMNPLDELPDGIGPPGRPCPASCVATGR